MRLVPKYFKPFLIAKIPRTDHMLDVSGFLLDICMPAVSGKIFIIILILGFIFIFRNSSTSNKTKLCFRYVSSDTFDIVLFLGRLVLSENY